uniref:Reelin domain-containing protein n=1 Tax=Oncorhynchus mykiss TaxID=8022 RepID=A0A8K9XTC7_ONCMY
MSISLLLPLWVAMSFSLTRPTLGFSRGASPASCLEMSPGHIRAQPQDPHHSHITLYTSASTYLPGDTVTVTVRSTRDFMGFLLQARSLGIAGRRGRGGRVAGTWTVTPPGTHTQRCLGDNDSLTHSDKQLKRNLSFVWRAPDTALGDIRFYPQTQYLPNPESLTSPQTQYLPNPESLTSPQTQYLPNPESLTSPQTQYLPNPESLTRPQSWTSSEPMPPPPNLKQSLEPRNQNLYNPLSPDPSLALTNPQPSTEPLTQPLTNPQPSTEPLTHPLTNPQPSTEPLTQPLTKPQPSTESLTQALTNPQPSTEPLTQPLTNPQPSTEPLTQPLTNPQPSTEPLTQPLTNPQPSTEPLTQPLTNSQPSTEPLTQSLTNPQPSTETLTQPLTNPQPSTEPLTQSRTNSQPSTEPLAPGGSISQNRSIGPNTNPNTNPNTKTRPGAPGEGKIPDIVASQNAWELGILLGCASGLGMILAIGFRYLYSQYCNKRTGVTLNDRERDYDRNLNHGGLIHIQDCTDLVRISRIRENSFVLLAEYNLLTPTGN